MMNFREIFNISYSYIGIIIIGVILLLLFLLDGKGSIKIIGGSFFVAGVLLFLIYFLAPNHLLSYFLNHLSFISSFLKIIISYRIYVCNNFVYIL